jgi:hypothetical protein
MKSLRIMIGLAVAVTALALAAVPALAAKEKPKIPTGEFIASKTGMTISPATPVIAKSNNEGEVEEFKFGGIPVECPALSSTSEVESERSPDLKMDLIFKKCTFPIKVGVLTRNMPFKFKHNLHLELHANGSAKILKVAADETEVKIPPFKCHVLIPAQEIPLAAEKREGEFETVEYSTETETVEGGKLKKFPRGFYELLEVEFVKMKGLKFEYKPEPGGKEADKCGYVKGEEGQFNAETGMVEGVWHFEGDVEEIKIPGGSIGFEPPA